MAATGSIWVSPLQRADIELVTLLSGDAANTEAANTNSINIPNFFMQIPPRVPLFVLIRWIFLKLGGWKKERKRKD